MENNKFPKAKKAIENFINDEDGNITRGKLLTIGSMIVILGSLLSIDVFAKHGSHSSHSSTSYIRGHSNSHSSHSNLHSSHSSHTSHSNTVAHSNSKYSAAGDYTGTLAPKASEIEGIKTPLSNDFETAIPSISAATTEPPITPPIKGEK